VPVTTLHGDVSDRAEDLPVCTRSRSADGWAKCRNRTRDGPAPRKKRQPPMANGTDKAPSPKASARTDTKHTKDRFF